MEKKHTAQPPHDFQHITVLKKEAVEQLNVQPRGIYLDATFGGGGHTRAILESNPTCKVVAFDWDKEAFEYNAQALKEAYGDRFIPIWGNFAHCYRLLRKHKIHHIDGVLADFGTSQHQIHTEDGFSFAKDSPLDMRMSKGHQYFTAEYVINKFSQKDLTKIFSQYGEEPASRKIATAIVHDRDIKPFQTTKQLADLICRLTSKGPRRKTHPATRVFQALRIFVNKELENIEKFLRDIFPFIKSGGTLACISFHSLEDRIVKEFLRDKKESLSAFTRKPLLPSDEEVASNPSSRSAKLRSGTKK